MGSPLTGATAGVKPSAGSGYQCRYYPRLYSVLWYTNVKCQKKKKKKKDPFTALNVLRKLLSALPSRLGGCQYKLTPEEHKLALHLLTVVEPFVGLAPCASHRALARQPTEILDAIAFHIDAKRDLLSLALSCKRLHSIVFPRHYEYRVIKCKASALSVWNHLVVHRSLARNVRRVEILDERTGEAEQAVPSDIMTTDTDMESTDDELALHDKQERFVVSALGRMTALQSFKWSCNHSLVAFERVWPALVKCQTVSEVEVNDNLIFHALPVDESHASTARKSKQRPAVVRASSLACRPLTNPRSPAA